MAKCIGGCRTFFSTSFPRVGGSLTGRDGQSLQCLLIKVRSFYSVSILLGLRGYYKRNQGQEVHPFNLARVVWAYFIMVEGKHRYALGFVKSLHLVTRYKRRKFIESLSLSLFLGSCRALLKYANINRSEHHGYILKTPKL